MKQRSKHYLISLASFVFVALSITGVALYQSEQSVSAASRSDMQSEIAQLQSDIEASQREAERLAHQADTYQNAIALLEKEQAILQGKINLSEAEHKDLKNKIKDTEERILKNQNVLSDTLQELYVQSEVSAIELIASSKSLGDFIDKQEYANSVRDQLQVAIVEIKELKDKLIDQKDKVEKVLARLDGEKQQLTAKKGEQSRLLEETRGQEAAYQSRVADLQKQQEKIEAALAASLASGSYKNVAPEGYVSAGTVIGTVGNTGYSFGAHLHLEVRTAGGVRVEPSGYIQHPPVDPAVSWISQRFGEPSDLYGSGYHSGTDYAAAAGTSIHAIQGGELRRACSTVMFGFYDYGYVAVITHPDGTVSIYGHMQGPC